mmetsp:Transcript_64017/g.147434  ORF Transcript_64017/g.147434 Transcript_64017/m.147434 type:complete len:265 (+) Transcript_64017:683-1477(+)
MPQAHQHPDPHPAALLAPDRSPPSGAGCEDPRRRPGRGSQGELRLCASHPWLPVRFCGDPSRSRGLTGRWNALSRGFLPGSAPEPLRSTCQTSAALKARIQPRPGHSAPTSVSLAAPVRQEEHPVRSAIHLGCLSSPSWPRNDPASMNAENSASAHKPCVPLAWAARTADLAIVAAHGRLHSPYPLPAGRSETQRSRAHRLVSRGRHPAHGAKLRQRRLPCPAVPPPSPALGQAMPAGEPTAPQPGGHSPLPALACTGTATCTE